tara:strand:+ start:173 stop:409 length:237 start_codon:yes stop_codon:yes gene_type:complete
MIALTTQDAIKAAVLDGHKVHWMNDGHTVRRNKSGTIVVDSPPIHDSFISLKLQHVIHHFGVNDFYMADVKMPTRSGH